LEASKIAGAVVMLIAARATGLAATMGAPHGALLIRDVTLISPERATPLPHADVLIENDRITAIGAQHGRPVRPADLRPAK
jgi:hypothetical protein